MNKFTHTPIGRLRLLAFIEGISLLALLFIAMPLKYMGDNPILVKVIGPIHGVLFLLYVFYVLKLGIERKWSLGRIFILGISSIVPFATFYYDKKILAKLQSA